MEDVKIETTLLARTSRVAKMLSTIYEDACTSSKNATPGTPSARPDFRESLTKVFSHVQRGLDTMMADMGATPKKEVDDGNE